MKTTEAQRKKEMKQEQRIIQDHQIIQTAGGSIKINRRPRTTEGGRDYIIEHTSLRMNSCLSPKAVLGRHQQDVYDNN